MAKRKARSRSRKKRNLAQTLKFEIVGLIMLGFSLVSLANLGAVSKACRLVATFFMGDWAFVLLIALLILSLYLMYKREVPNFWQRQFFGIYLILMSWLLLVHISAVSSGGIPYDNQNRSIILQTWQHYWNNAMDTQRELDMGGGMFGAVFYAIFHFLFDEAGSKVAAVITGMIGLILLTGLSFKDTFIRIMQPIGRFFRGQWRESVKEVKQYFEEPERQAPILEETPNATSPPEDSVEEEVIISNFADRVEAEPIEEVTAMEPMEASEVENLDYQLPPLTLLNHFKKGDRSYERGHINENAKKLEQTLASFGVKAKITQIHLGPAVTQYEMNPEIGVKVSRIVSLTDDIALALAAKDIRIEAPIPGKSAIGIEVPNQEVAMVSLREVLEEKNSEKRSGLLRFALGRDISGAPISWELNKMPHLLVAGSTGSGKSVCINGIITSILMRAKPHEVKMMMIDPKMVELNVYNGIPHLLTPVVTDPKKAAQALRKIVLEMERRYTLFSGTGTRNMEGYNEYIRRQNLEEGVQQPLLPYIVVLVDELADLMMVASSEVEDTIIRIAQMARAAGIHLIIATQRPSVDVITGIIKANIPSRIAFSVSSQVDSRTILDMGGAEKLLGRGDMLFLPVGESKPIRVQGAFVSDQEVEKVVRFVSKQQKVQYQEEMIPEEVEENGVEETSDDLYDEAVQLVAEMQTASVSLLQRRFRIGYARAARLIDEMEIRGIVGPYEGSKPRNVLVAKDFDKKVES